MARGERRHRFLPGLRSLLLADVADVRKTPEHLLPRRDVRRDERLAAELLPQRIEQEGRRVASHRLAEDGEVFRAQAFVAAAPLQGVEISRQRQSSVARARVELDALRDGRARVARGRVFRVDRPDPRQGLPGPVLGRIARRKTNPVRQQDEVIRHLLRRVEILCEQRRRHHQRRPRIREALPRRAIHGKLPRRIERIDAGEIAQGVGVFVVGKPTQHHRPWITGVGAGEVIERLPRPADEQIFLHSGWLLLLLRRHLAVEDLVDNVFPDIRIAGDVRGLEIEFALLLFSRMAVEAMARKHGTHLSRHLRGVRGSGDQKTERSDSADHGIISSGVGSHSRQPRM